ncbi:DMT family transporter [Haloarcula sp. S1AR25-5A]|uniref:DMT family transporter n=1 Tax=Haloarcula terrestris TaxID=2950533 RepID=A0AAE4JIF8_9EURY|nr:DMT family transporter [Haloarcula terrestris]MDS0223833.1 DMT family transporter [Haloarcula terrestris]
MTGTILAPRYRTAGLFVLLAAVWGGTYPAVTVGLESFPPILYAALRLDVGALVLVLYVGRTQDYWRPRSTRDWAAVLSGGLLTLAGYSILQNIGQQTVPSAIAAVLTGLIPILTIGFAKVFLPEESFGLTELVGVGFGFLGLAVITRPDPANLLSGNTVGQVVLVLGAASFALGGVLTQRADPEMPFPSRTAWAMVVGAVFTHLASLASPSESVRLVRWSVEGLLGLAYLGVFVSATGYLLYFYLLPRLGSVELNLVTYATAMFGTVFSWLLFTEPVTASTFFGFSLVILGFMLLKWEKIYNEYQRRRHGIETK